MKNRRHKGLDKYFPEEPMKPSEAIPVIFITDGEIKYNYTIGADPYKEGEWIKLEEAKQELYRQSGYKGIIEQISNRVSENALNWKEFQEKAELELWSAGRFNKQYTQINNNNNKEIMDSKIALQVLEFHKTFEHPIGESFVGFTENRGAQRHDYMFEEVKEFSDAVDAGDSVEQVDASLDNIYFSIGNLVEQGVAHKFQELFDEVHRSNMSKSCSTVEEAEATVDAYVKTFDQPAMWKQIGDYYVVFNTLTGKTVKSINYSKPNLAKILNA